MATGVYIKFNCYDLAEQNSQMGAIQRKINAAAGDISAVRRALEPQLKDNGELRSVLARAAESAASCAERIFALGAALDQIVDIYFAAERRVRQGAEELLTPLGRSAAAPLAAFPSASATLASALLPPFVAPAPLTSSAASASSALPANPSAAGSAVAACAVSSLSGRTVILEEWLANLIYGEKPGEKTDA